MVFPLAVTVSQRGRSAPTTRARAAAARWGLPYLERPRKTGLEPQLGVFATTFLVLGGDGWTLRDAHGALRFSPGMAMLRIKRIDAGHPLDDQVIKLGELRPGDVVLDGTLGLGADALVCAKAVGPSGRVIGVEQSLPLFALVSEGVGGPLPFTGMAPIACVHGLAGEVLAGMGDASVDVVLFDPMFELPKKASPAFEILRRYASFEPLTPATLGQARRVARRWVLVKSGRFTRLLAELGLQPEPGSRSADVRWARVRGGA